MRKSFRLRTNRNNDKSRPRSAAGITVAALIILLAACTGRGWKSERLPDLKPLDLSSTITIRTAIVELPGLPTLSEKEVKQYFRVLKETTKTYADADLKFTEPDRVAAEAFFLRYIFADEYIELARKRIIDPRKPGAEDAVVAAIENNMVPANVDALMAEIKQGADAAQIAAKCIYPDKCLKRIENFRKDKFDSEEKLRKALQKFVPAADYEDLANAVRSHPGLAQKADQCTSEDACIRLVANYQIEWLNRMYAIQNSDGRTPLANAFRYLQYESWDRLAIRQKDYDLVLINFPIASAELATPWQVALRAGLTTGMTSMAPNRLGGMVVMSMYPFFADNDVFNELRGSPPEHTALDDFAWYTTHEMGHLLRRWGHPVPAQPGCLMTPISNLDYAKWVRELKSRGTCDPAPPKLKRF